MEEVSTRQSGKIPILQTMSVTGSVWSDMEKNGATWSFCTSSSSNLFSPEHDQLMVQNEHERPYWPRYGPDAHTRIITPRNECGTIVCKLQHINLTIMSIPRVKQYAGWSLKWTSVNFHRKMKACSEYLPDVNPTGGCPSCAQVTTSVKGYTWQFFGKNNFQTNLILA